MKFALIILVLFMAGGIVMAHGSSNQMEWMTLDDWLDDNIDPQVLQTVRQLDEQKIRLIFSQLQQAMQGTNISQLGALRETAAQVAPLLQKYEATAPYGDWLQTRLDYLSAAGELQRRINAAMAAQGNAPLSSRARGRLEQEVWVRELDREPLPPLAQKYLPGLKQAFAAEKVPPELAWVAEVESSFNSRARSPAGAAGMFQLMPQTAREEKLSTWPFDQRLQPEKSAHAAAKYLRALHGHYGDWELALAAYNCGEGRVDKLLRQRHARSFEAIARYLPSETQMYVPKVAATLQKREGKDLELLTPPKL